MDVKELAAELDVSPDTVINWEIRGVKPRWHMEELEGLLGVNS